MTAIEKRPCGQSGMSLVETAIVLGIVSVIIAAVWMVSSVVYENARQYQANRQLQTTVQNIRQLYTRVNALTNLADVTATLDSQKAFPIEMRVDQSSGAGKLNHPWGSSSTGTVLTYNRTASTFGIVFSKLPQKACIGLATKLSGGEISNITGMKVGTGSSPSAVSSLPISVVTAASLCTSTSGDNTIEWDFDIRG